MSGPYAPTPGLDIDESRQTAVWVALIVPYVLALVTVILRFSSRRIARSGSWFDDWLVALAMMLATGILAGTVTSIEAGLGMHIWYFPIHDIASHAQNILLGLFELDNMYYVCYGFAKMSVLALYWRNFKNRFIRRTVYVGIIAVILWMGVAVTLTVLECQPVWGFWLDPLEAYCPIPRIPLHLGLSIASAVMNVLILILPLPLFLDPDHTRLQRFILVALFSFGLFVCIVSVVRTLAVSYTDITSVDVFWNLANVWAWTAAEVQLAIVAANLPTLGHIVAHFVPSLESESLSPPHTSDAAQRVHSAAEKSVRQRSRTQTVSNPRVASLMKPLPHINTDLEKAVGPDTPREREPAREIEHGIAEWEFVSPPRFTPEAAHHAHPGTPIQGRWSRPVAEAGVTGAMHVGSPSRRARGDRRSRGLHDSSDQSHTLVSSPKQARRETNSYASDAALLPIQANMNRSSSNLPVQTTDRSSSAIPRSPLADALAPPPAVVATTRRAGPAESGRTHPVHSHASSSGSESYGRAAVASTGGRRSWYRRGTATTPEWDSSDDERARYRRSKYSSGGWARHYSSGRYGDNGVFGTEGRYGSHAPSYSVRYSAYGHGESTMRAAPENESKPTLRPRNPRRETPGTHEAYRVDAPSPEPVAATQVRVTRAGPSAGNTPQLVQGGFAEREAEPPAGASSTAAAARRGPFARAVPAGPASAPLPNVSVTSPSTPGARGSLEDATRATAQLSALAAASSPELSSAQGMTNATSDALAAWRAAHPRLSVPGRGDDKPLPARPPGRALEPASDGNGEIVVQREVRVENERWSQLRERERRERERREEWEKRKGYGD